jgi:SAM-dependent methyltransferase
VIPEAEGVYAAVLARDDRRAVTRDRNGATVELRSERWMAGAEAVDLRVLQRALGPVLDVGCGPGRHVRALARRGVRALGLDTSPAAVRIARERGTAVLLGSVFDPVPLAGRWRTTLLLDGNIGIGGEPGVLLARVAELLAPGGLVICEGEAPGGGVRAGPVRLEHGMRRSQYFPWAHVAIDALEEPARGAGLAVGDRWEDGTRWFATLVGR